MAGVLYLIPTLLGPGDVADSIPEGVRKVAARLEYFIVEHPKSARRFLKQLATPTPLQRISMTVLDEHTPPRDLPRLIEPLLAGKDMGLMAEAGCPGIADPGAAVVRLAHARGIRVAPLAGPSSIVLALMASGLNGQSFAFHGYLPVEAGKRDETIKKLEADSRSSRRTQIFIETPYRNRRLFEALVQVCRGDTLLCIASDLMLPTETVATRTIREWQRTAPDLERRPSVFLLQAHASP